MYGKSVHISAASRPITASSSLDIDLDREMELFKRCLASGVAISLGSSFSTEELGWFRISFAVEEQALYAGLQRLLQCLECIDAERSES